MLQIEFSLSYRMTNIINDTIRSAFIFDDDNDVSQFKDLLMLSYMLPIKRN